MPVGAVEGIQRAAAGKMGCCSMVVCCLEESVGFGPSGRLRRPPEVAPPEGGTRCAGGGWGNYQLALRSP